MSHHPNWYLSGIHNFEIHKFRKSKFSRQSYLFRLSYPIRHIDILFSIARLGRHGNISRERWDLGTFGTFGTFLFPYLKLSIIFISFFSAFDSCVIDSPLQNFVHYKKI